MITLALGTDHRGFLLKEYLKQLKQINNSAVTWLDCGAYNQERSNYPEFACAVIEKIISGQATHGILLCGSGIGMVIAANRVPHIYAGLAWNEEIARLSKEDDNTNVLSLPADFITEQQAVSIIFSWLTATFKNKDPYNQRLVLIDQMSKKFK